MSHSSILTQWSYFYPFAWSMALEAFTERWLLVQQLHRVCSALRHYVTCLYRSFMAPFKGTLHTVPPSSPALSAASCKASKVAAGSTSFLSLRHSVTTRLPGKLWYMWLAWTVGHISQAFTLCEKFLHHLFLLQNEVQLSRTEPIYWDSWWWVGHSYSMHVNSKILSVDSRPFEVRYKQINDMHHERA